jgi:hypothetical protein
VRGGHSPKCGAGLDYSFILGPLVQECHHPKAFTLHINWLISFLEMRKKKRKKRRKVAIIT